MSPGTCVVMVTVSERLPLLNRFLASLAEHEPGRDIFIHMQGDDREAEIEASGLCWGYLHTRERLGCHAARVLALRAVEGYSSYVNVDDDVYLMPTTDWQPAIEKAHEPGVGFVLTNWVRHLNLYDQAVAGMRSEFLRQVFVYNGGGMAYTEPVADLMRSLDPCPSRYDDIWPLTAYLAGYDNYRYRGSLAVHHIRQRGGMQAYMAAEPRPLLCQRWVDYRYISGARIGQEVAIPQDGDLKQVAREVHARARAENGW